ncbi:MAG: 3'-5' exonuclease [Chloroflexota bacterium]|nr:3'-5' exonuclease [Chloroflexota bacterium]
MSSKPVLPSEAYVSVDVETSGPNPGTYSMLSIGACLVSDPQRGFYVELQPLNSNAIPGALAISDLSMEALAEHGLPPARALARFEAWLEAEIPSDQRPVFVALNAPFDWMFVNDYFHRFLERNPFGHSALDIKAFYMGLTGIRWARTSMKYLARRYLAGRKLTHNALRDAQDQAELFAKILAEAEAQSRKLKVEG